MTQVIFWDVDTQYDFIFSDGALYVPGAEQTLGPLARLTRHAQTHHIPIVASVDYHLADDAEISTHPDFKDTFPPHCLRGTHGQAKVDATRLRNALWIDSEPQGAAALSRRVAEHRGEVVFRKQKFDVFSNANVDTVIGTLKPTDVVLYGVALDVCNKFAIDGLLQRKLRVHLVTDAVKALDAARGEALVADWLARGVVAVDSAAVVAGYQVGHLPS